MQRLHGAPEAARPTIGEAALAAIDALVGIVAALMLLLLVLQPQNLPGAALRLVGLSLIAVGALPAAVCLAGKRPAAWAFQGVAALGGLFLCLFLAAWLPYADAWTALLLYGGPVLLMVGGFVYLRWRRCGASE